MWTLLTQKLLSFSLGKFSCIGSLMISFFSVSPVFSGISSSQILHSCDCSSGPLTFIFWFLFLGSVLSFIFLFFFSIFKFLSYFQLLFLILYFFSIVSFPSFMGVISSLFSLKILLIAILSKCFSLLPILSLFPLGSFSQWFALGSFLHGRGIP